MPQTHPSPAKSALRDELLAARSRRTPEELAAAADALTTRLLAWQPVRRAVTVAAYVPVGSEPGSRRLLDELAGAGHRVLLPVVLSGKDLDWAPYRDPDDLLRAGFGLLEPGTPRLGPEAVATADVLLVPGLAVSRTGDRLGRGAGCYDRALARVDPDTPVVALLHDDEVGRPVPTEPHDRPVSHAATPSGIVAFVG